jgi:PAS domain S-box-containing protein
MPLFDQLPLPALWVSPDGRMIERLNPLATALLRTLEGGHVKEARLEGAGLLPDWLQGELDRFSGLAELEYSFEREFMLPHPTRWINVLIKRLEDSSGTLVVLIDITSQKGLESLLRQAHRELEEQVEKRIEELASANASLRSYIEECHHSAVALKKLSSAVEQTADHVIITDKHGIIEYVNPAFEKLTGFSLHEAVGQTPRLVKSAYHPPEFFRSLWKTILAGEVFRAEFINQKKNGELYREEKTITPLKDDHGRITHFVSVGRSLHSTPAIT